MIIRDSNFYKQLIPIRTVFYGVVLSLFVLISLNITQVWAQNTSYTVDNVRVDVTAENAVQAREQAFEAAQIKAYETLSKRLLSAQEREGFETPPLSKISSLVQNFQVTDEKLSATRYSGTYEISFRPHSMGRSIEKTQQAAQPSPRDTSKVMANSNAQSRAKVLVIPVIQKDGRNYIWANGPYREAWKTLASQTNVIIPVGDIQDRSAIRDDEVLSYDYNRFRTLLRRYDADQTFIAVTNPQSTSNGAPAAIVKLYEAKPSGPLFLSDMTMPIYTGEMPDDLFMRVAKQSKVAIDSNIIKKPKPIQTATNPVLSGNTENLTAELSFSSIRDWVAIKRNIEKTRGISSLTIKSMTAQSAVVDIVYRGDLPLLAQNFRQQQLMLQSPIRGGGQYGSPLLYQITQIR